MEELQQNKSICVNEMEIVYQSDVCTVRRYCDERGSLIMACHKVFPGIDLIFKDFRRTDCVINMESPSKNVLVIEHCREGRVECQMDNYFFYLAAGDVTLRCTDQTYRDIAFPLKAYMGIDIVIDLEKTPKCLACLLSDVNVEPVLLVQKFGLHDNAFHFLRQNERIDHIFAELYAVPESIQKGYLKVKILEILLFLTGLELEENESLRRQLSRQQVRLAKDAHAYLAEHMHEHITIAQLAKHLGTSQTQLKDSFRNVYGTSVQSFICEQKMQAAAIILKETERKIVDIAGEFGYANASKFSTAFQRVMGKPPAQYRIDNE